MDLAKRRHWLFDPPRPRQNIEMRVFARTRTQWINGTLPPPRAPVKLASLLLLVPAHLASHPMLISAT
jgi:hypothetical protein